ncbi:MAG: MBL fold metallo-hydrolase [Bacteroidetes bacterium]|jgi:hydroxyacylglutathione hydrolase|nr:MBL fold metallo-hydrolase [Bacteroidota bacterium]MBT3747422.1 MBL fold metallo-hydrolase [Bacteroidota bacterium]MBT4400840.1 MBL fold metallo-hydrolase [Bacteroidota bacterium]MBT4411863.1 MBL fold metallo-hydrolase [Bacteroidota bacterium]MBT5426289.1 MBL fold metallo-hydrolase [Bacteroidota bacterium]
MIHRKQFVFNPIQVNTWVIHNDHGDGVIFDPGCSNHAEEAQLVDYLMDMKINPVALLATHGHFDHIPGVAFLKNKYHCPLKGHSDDQLLLDHAVEQGRLFGFDFGEKNPVFDDLLSGGQTLKFEGLEFEILHVPGHSMGSLAYYCKEAHFVVVGDVLFKGSIGRTDLPGGDYDTLIDSIKKNLLCLPDDTIVLSGHGPETTIGGEKSTNPFL